MCPDTLPPDAAYAALQARDARFDGRLYVGVTSTGIYCRPVCRVRLPRRENCRFFDSAAQAEAAAFRPCLKCRPELAPRALPWSTADASRTLAQQAAVWLDACDDAGASVEDLAAHLGITSRHLRRIFQAEHGVAPLQYLQTRRLLLAKALLTDSTLPVQDVAHAAGFASLRRFNAAFLAHYRLQPSALRRAGRPDATRADAPASRLRLSYRPPYDAPGVLAFLAPRAVAGVEVVDAGSVTRSLALQHCGQRHAGWLRVTLKRQGEVAVELSPTLWPAVGTLLPRLRQWLDLDADPQAIAAALGEGAVPGQRLPGCLDRFELTVRAVLGQQVTVAAARTLAGRFVQRFGDELPAAPPGCERLFPTPERIAAASRDDIASLGIIGRRADSLIALAQAWPQLAFAQREGTPEAAALQLTEIPGIGPWTAAYMLMRGWSWPDSFPPGDVVLRKALSGTGPLLSPKAYAAAAERYRPYRSYAVLHLWRHA
ncbi:Ada metal-binding domain-containing protein [Roseateles sp. BYS87W]|uniref:DNA-3-methyladenine glycosylase II n=1 Tax=Pelomonas baiyunensis TaxID=3299026 RepID=A0ABW7H4M8_9BURK